MPNDEISLEITESDSAAVGWVAFEIPAELRLRAETIVEQLRASSDKQQHAAELIDIVVALTDRGLYYYFLHPLEVARVGVITRKAVELALGTAGRTLPLVVRKTVNSLNDAQLSSLADFIDHILISEEDSSDP